MSKITPFLWFDTQAGEAMDFYKTVFKDFQEHSRQVMPDGKVMVGSWSMNGQDFMAMNAGPEFKFSEAISFYVDCADQAEVDYYWNALLADGGEESQCGWLKDKFGLSWQIVPKQLNELMSDPNPVKSKAVMDCMLKMKKIVVQDLEDAYNQSN